MSEFVELPGEHDFPGKGGRCDMCGRFLILDDNDIAEVNKIVQEIGMKYDGRGLFMKTGDVYPTNNAAVLAMQNGKPSLSLMQWGFPKWDGKGVIINAKSETAAEKKMFAAALMSHRCVIPSNGFYEWAATGDAETKVAKLAGSAKSTGESNIRYRFTDPDNPMLYMAGLYSDFKPKESAENDGEESGKLPTERFVILTRDANIDVAEIHDRMPVILYKNEIIRWLTDLDFAKGIMSRDSVRLAGKPA